MNLIVGLGNPGPKYNWTRHNFGALALDFYAKKYDLTWSDKPRMGALWLKDGDNIFIKPQDFYNDSGFSVQKFASFYKITPDNILVLCDDFNLDFGALRYRAKGSAGGNNGLKSIIQHLGTEDFPRLRLGTGNPLRAKMGDTDFVLGKFTPEEKTKLAEILTEASTYLHQEP